MDRSVYSDSNRFGHFTESSVKTPGFHTLVTLGKRLPMNPYYFQRLDAVDPPTLSYNGYVNERRARGHHYAYTAWRSGKYNTITGGVVSSGLPSFGSSRAIVTNRLLDKIRDQEIDLGVSLGEYRETAAFICGTMTKVFKSFRSFRRGNVSEALRTLTGRKNDAWRDIPGVASNAWLAYTYGLRPLVNDAYSAMKVLSKPDKAEVPIKTVRSSHRQECHLVTGYSTTTKDWVDYEINTSGQIQFVVTNPLIRTLDQLGLTNPLMVAWELVPFSFVVDWFLPVGKAIQGIVPPQGVRFVDGWVYHKARGKTIHTTFYQGKPPWNTRSESREFEKRREILSAFPRYRVIVPDLSLSKTQIGSGLALLFQTSVWGKQKQTVRPEPLRKGRRDERNWREQWPPDPWWAR